MWQADIIEGALNDKEAIEDIEPPAAKGLTDIHAQNNFRGHISQ